jgi:thioester reductase-like protein
MVSDRPLVLLTGATGYIGRRLLPQFERPGL